MKQIRNLKEYSVLEINDILDSFRSSYDVVRLVDVEECRVLEVDADGGIHHRQECFRFWNRSYRCENCSSYRACHMHCTQDKTDNRGREREAIHSIPIYLEMLNGELQMCVIECLTLLDENGEVSDSGDAALDNALYVRTHDVLTRLYTAEMLFRMIRQRLLEEPEGDWLLVMGNIRNFALVNRLFGIEGGNRLLVRVADILRSHCSGDEIYGRYRDDRFVLLIRRERFDAEAFLGYMKQVENLIESPIYNVQVKLGIFEILDPEMPVATMLEHADLAVSSIRDEKDEPIAWYRPEMTKRQLNRQHIVESFEQALEDGEFRIFLQPQVRFDGTIRGAEALVRWIHPDGTVVPPGDFLDVLHESELLSHLDIHVWELAARQLRRWKNTEFRDLYISINVDPTDFYYVDVPAILTEICDRNGVERESLRVEITETALVEDTVSQRRMVDRLHEAGFLVEIDDFGKGFSSLSLLKNLHADVLKIDMGFIQGTHDAQRSRIILRSVIAMAKNLNMDVVTEGVETRAQVDQLIELGCMNFQGFFFSRPVSIHDFELVARASL